MCVSAYTSARSVARAHARCIARCIARCKHAFTTTRRQRVWLRVSSHWSLRKTRETSTRSTRRGETAPVVDPAVHVVEPIRRNRVFRRERPDAESMNEKAYGDFATVVGRRPTEMRHSIYSKWSRSIASSHVRSLLVSQRCFLPHEGKLWGSYERRLVGFSAIFRDAWVLTARHRTFTPDCSCENVPLLALTLPLFRVEVRQRAGNVWRFLSQVVSAIRDRRCDISRSFASPWQVGFLSLDPRSRVLRKARHSDLFEFCISRERGKDSDATERLVIVFRSR